MGRLAATVWCMAIAGAMALPCTASECERDRRDKEQRKDNKLHNAVCDAGRDGSPHLMLGQGSDWGLLPACVRVSTDNTLPTLSGTVAGLRFGDSSKGEHRPYPFSVLYLNPPVSGAHAQTVTRNHDICNTERTPKSVGGAA